MRRQRDGVPWYAALARLTLKGANFLLLDEPTNHLDLETQEILEQVLKQFPGTVLLVTHDRWLVQALATQVWRVDGDEMRAYKGNYEEYLKLRGLEMEGAGKPSGDDPQRQAQLEADRERAREERRQRKAAERRAEAAAAMEGQIHTLEARLAGLSTQLEAASLAGDVARVQRLGIEYQQTDAELHRIMAEWAELA